MKFIQKNYLFLDQTFTTKAEVLGAISAKAKEVGLLRDKSIVKDLEAREAEYSTAIGHGIAIPHAKSEAIKVPALMVWRLKDAILWGDEEVNLCLSILTPKESGAHLKILSAVSRKLMHENFRQLLQQADREVIYQALKKIEEEENNG